MFELLRLLPSADLDSATATLSPHNNPTPDFRSVVVSTKASSSLLHLFCCFCSLIGRPNLRSFLFSRFIGTLESPSAPPPFRCLSCCESRIVGSAVSYEMDDRCPLHHHHRTLGQDMFGQDMRSGSRKTLDWGNGPKTFSVMEDQNCLYPPTNRLFTLPLTRLGSGVMTPHH